MRLQAWHAIVLLVVILLVFGASRLPDITRNVGRSMKIFKEEVKDLRDDGSPAADSATTAGESSGTVNTTSTDTPPSVTPPGGGQPSGGSETTNS